jgi:transcription elongation factor Elf1
MTTEQIAARDFCPKCGKRSLIRVQSENGSFERWCGPCEQFSKMTIEELAERIMNETAKENWLEFMRSEQL